MTAHVDPVTPAPFHPSAAELAAALAPTVAAEPHAAALPQAPGDAPTDATTPIEGGDLLDRAMVKRVLEAALFSAGEPLATSDLRRLFDEAIDADTIRSVLDELRHDWHTGSVELTAVATGWRFRVRPEYQRYLDRLNPEKPPKYSRAVMETLAIIAYRQPVTRADIEQIRGVTVSAQTLKALEDRGWIQVLGQLDKPGRPSIFGTTKAFLNDLNLKSETDLPPLEELQAALDLTANGTLQVTPAASLIAAAGDASPITVGPPDAVAGQPDASSAALASKEQ